MPVCHVNMSDEEAKAIRRAAARERRTTPAFLLHHAMVAAGPATCGQRVMHVVGDSPVREWTCALTAGHAGDHSPDRDDSKEGR